MTQPNKPGQTELTIEVKLTIPNDGGDIIKASQAAHKIKPQTLIQSTADDIQINNAKLVKVTAVRVE